MSKSWKDLSDNAKRIVQQGNTGGTLPARDWAVLLREVVEYERHRTKPPLTMARVLVFLMEGVSLFVTTVGFVFACFISLVFLIILIIDRVETGSFLPLNTDLLYTCIGFWVVWLLVGRLPSGYLGDLKPARNQGFHYKKYATNHVLVAVLDFLEMLKEAGLGSVELEIEFFLKAPFEGHWGQRLEGTQVELEQLPKERMVSIKMPVGNHSQFAAEILAPVRMAAVLATYESPLRVFLLTVEATLRADTREFVRADRLPYMVGLKATEEAILLDTADVQPLEPTQMEETNGLRVVYRDMMEAIRLSSPPPMPTTEEVREKNWDKDSGWDN